MSTIESNPNPEPSGSSLIQIEAPAFQLDPSVEVFFSKEAESLRDALQEVAANHPKIMPQIRDLCGRVADPTKRTIGLTNQNFPIVLKQSINAAESTKRTEGLVAAIPAESRGVGDEFIELTKRWQAEWDAIVEDVQTNGLNFVNGVIGLCRNIIARENHPLQVPPGTLVSDVKIRDEVMREYYGPNHKELVGWDLEFLVKSGSTSAAQNRYRLKMFESLGPEEAAVADRTQMNVLFPLPLGEDKVSARFVYEELLKREPSQEDFDALEAALSRYLSERKKSIFPEG